MSKWLEYDVDILKKKYPTNGTEIQELLDRHSKEAIYNKAYRLNISFINHKKYGCLKHNVCEVTKDDIDWDEVVNKYVVEGKNAKKISKEMMCSYPAIRNILINRNVMMDKKQAMMCCPIFHKHILLDKEIIQMLDGLLLGDGCVHRKGDSKDVSCLVVPQTERRKDWLICLKDIFERKNFCCSIHKRIAKLNGKQFKQSRFETYSYIELDKQKKRWYPNGKKIVPKDIELTPVVLAQWYMGDGFLDISRTGKKKQNYYRIGFCSESFTKEGNEFLANILMENYGYKPIVRKFKKQGYRIFMSRKEDVKDFLLKTLPYKVSCFDYKWRALDDPMFQNSK